MTKYFHWFIVLFVFLACIPTIGLSALFDWDEVNFAECAREMIVSKDYFNVTINFQAFWEKPPLFIWMQALSMLFLLFQHMEQVYESEKLASEWPCLKFLACVCFC